MKLIIDIDEEMYKRTIEENCTISIIDYMIINGKTLQTELEEIKAEIRELSYNGEICTIDRYKVEKALDNHIKELNNDKRRIHTDNKRKKFLLY